MEIAWRSATSSGRGTLLVVAAVIRKKLIEWVVYVMMMLARMMVSPRKRQGSKTAVYRLRKKLLKVSMNENELSLALRVVVSLSVAHPRDDGDVDVDDDDDGRARMRLARSSYFAWVSRGFWPKRPKAHGAAVDVGNKEKGAELDEDISGV
jgi:hypothetical protein